MAINGALYIYGVGGASPLLTIPIEDILPGHIDRSQVGRVRLEVGVIANAKNTAASADLNIDGSGAVAGTRDGVPAWGAGSIGPA